MNGQLESWRAWWRERVSFEQKAAVVVLFLGAVLVAGWLAADSLSTASAGVSSSTSNAVETVERVVTVREPGKTTRVPVVKLVHVAAARRPAAKTKTVARTSTVYATSTVRLPEYLTHVVKALTHTVTDTITDVLTTTVTKTQWRVVTVVEKSPPVTVTVTAPAP